MYLEGFKDLSDIARNFCVDKSELGDVIVAAYDTPPYEGYAFVLTKIDGKLYEVHGSHCSCYGLENQWEPEPCSKEDLLFRLADKNSCFHCNKDKLKAIIERL